MGALIGGGIGGIVWKGTRVSADISPTQKELRFAVEDHHATIRVTVNGSHYWTGLAFLDTGSFEKGWEIKDWPVRVYTKPNDTLPLVDTKVYSSELGLAEIKANRLVIVPQGWDTNANDRALEIVDEHRIPVFQMVLAAANQLDVNGVFSEGWAKSGMRFTPLFKYPSQKHRGEFVEYVDLLPLTAKSLYQLYLESCGSDGGGSHGGHRIELPDKSTAIVDYKLCSNLDSKAAWLNVFMPKHGDAAAILEAFATQYRERLEPELRMGNAYLRIEPGQKMERGTNLVFTGVIGIYHEGLLLPEQPDEISKAFEKHGAHVRFFGPDYVFVKNSSLSQAAGRY